jgi:hypothetical protein
MNKFEERFCQEFLLCEAERFFPRRVQVLKIAIKTGDTQHIDGEGKKPVALFLYLLALGDLSFQFCIGLSQLGRPFA